MSDCEKCGRHDGHWLGCKTVGSPVDPARFADPAATLQLVDAEEVTAGSPCAKDGCDSDRAPQGKGPQPKYCETHKTGSKK